MLSAGGLCEKLITHPEKSYRVRFECDLETSTIRGPRYTRAVKPRGELYISI